jgi:hypothetical protein
VAVAGVVAAIAGVAMAVRACTGGMPATCHAAGAGVGVPRREKHKNSDEQGRSNGTEDNLFHIFSFAFGPVSGPVQMIKAACRLNLTRDFEESLIP